MENLQRRYNQLLKAYKTWSLLSENWLALLKRKDYIAANMAKSEADVEFKEQMKELEKNITKFKDDHFAVEITNKLKKLNIYQEK